MSDTEEGQASKEANEGTGHGHKSGHRRLGIVVLVVGLVFILAAGAWGAYAWVWQNNSQKTGNSLIQSERDRQNKVLQDEAAKTQACSDPTSVPASPDGTIGLLEIDAIHLVAPVQEGTSDAVLNVAVGHLSSSVQPGQNGTAVLQAHNVSYFVNTSKLVVGDLVRYTTQCMAYTFVVSAHQVAPSSIPIYNTPGPSLVMITCWPTNALWFTPDRYIVTTTEVSAQPLTKADLTQPAVIPASAVPPTVPAPPELVAQGLTLTTYSVPMGKLSIEGTPTETWAQGPGPLAVESSAVSSYIGGVKSLQQKRSDWWEAIAPGVTPPAALWGATISSYPSPLNVQITVSGETATSTVLSTTARTSTGAVYKLVIDQSITDGVLHITDWTATPA